MGGLVFAGGLIVLMLLTATDKETAETIEKKREQNRIADLTRELKRQNDNNMWGC